MNEERERLAKEVYQAIKEVKKVDRLTLLTDYLGDTLRSLSSAGYTPREITTAINKVLKKNQNKTFPKFVRESDVVSAMRILKIKPAKGKKRLKPSGQSRTPELS